MSVRVYSYGVLSETTHGKREALTPEPVTDIESQLRAAQDYYNALVDNENKRRESVAAKRRELYPDYERTEGEVQAANERIEAVLQEIRDHKRRYRTTKIPAELASKLKQAKGERKICSDREKAERKAIWEDPAQLVEVVGVRSGNVTKRPAWAVEIDKAANDRAKELRGQTTAFWGTYQAVEEAFQSAKTDRPGGPLQQKLRRGEGAVCYHFQGANAMTWETATEGKDARMRVWPDPVQKSKHNRRWWCQFWLRSEGRVPVYVRVPFVRHRPLPDGAVIKWVKLHRWQVGTRWRYELHFTLSAEIPARPVGEGVVGVDVGWRFKPDGSVRAAYWCGSDGGEGEVVIPAERVGAYLHLRDLREIRDKRFDLMRAELLAWLCEYKDLPESHTQRFRTLDKWRSTQALKWSYRWWLSNRIEGDGAIIDRLREYAVQEDHLFDWQANEAMKFEDWRNWYYRNVAQELGKRYQTVKIEQLDLGDLQRLAVPGEDNLGDYLKKYKNVASPSLLIHALKERFGSVAEVASEYTTMTCHACKGLNDTGKALTHQCEHCGGRWDIDQNAAKNILVA